MISGTSAGGDSPVSAPEPRARRGPQTFLLTATVIGTELVLALLGWNAFQAHRSLERALDGISQSEKLKDDALHFRDVMTSSMEMAVSTGNQFWTDRYSQYRIRLDSALDRSLAVLAQEGLASGLEYRGQLSALARLNGLAIDLIEAGQSDSAQYLVFGNRYARVRDSLGATIEGIGMILQERTVRLAEDQKHRMLFSVYILTGMASGLFIIWAVVLHFIRKWDARLRAANQGLQRKSAELSELNKSLEEKVAARTADISAKHAQLAALNGKLVENQSQLLQAEKMASIGQLASGVAHEINNPMSFILGNLSCLGKYQVSMKTALLGLYALARAGQEEHDEHVQRDPGDKDPAASTTLAGLWDGEDIPFILEDADKVISESIAGGNRIKDIVSNLKTFAHLDESELKSTDVNTCIESTLQIAASEFKHRCEVILRLGPLPPLDCRAGQLNQVFLNILMNAVQAIPERGRITVESRSDGREITVMISDTGIGIPRENLTKLFTPFFTTKPVGKGVGLGLSLSHGIIKSHGGWIGVRSEPDQGAEFTIHLPLENGRPGKPGNL